MVKRFGVLSRLLIPSNLETFCSDDGSRDRSANLDQRTGLSWIATQNVEMLFGILYI